MTETGELEAIDPQDSGFPRLKRKLYENRWWVVFLVLTYLVFVIPKWGGGTNFGYTAWACSGGAAIAVQSFWADRTKLWFWLAVILVVVVHVVVFSSIHWTKASYLGAIYRSMCILDATISFGVMWLAQKIWSTHLAQGQSQS